MHVQDRYNIGNDYRNPDFQQSASITLPGAAAALHDLTGTLIDALNRAHGSQGSLVERAVMVREYMARGNGILAAVRKYPLGSVSNRLSDTCDAIVATHNALCGVYAESRRLAQGELLREAGL